MDKHFPTLTIGEFIEHKSLRVFPLYGDSQSEIDYLLCDEALESESLLVEEIDESGSVPELQVENKGDVAVLLIEGEELVGAKQNRVLNTSILIGPKQKTKIPVSCVEQGRWAYRSRNFSHGGGHSSSKLRYSLKKSVSHSCEKGDGQKSDQGEVWREVDKLLCSLKVSSGSAAMHDAKETHDEGLKEFQEKLKYVDDATGFAVAIADKVVAIDVFDKPSTCCKVWDRLLSGFALDALAEEAETSDVESEAVKRLMGSVDDTDWSQIETVGIGSEFRAQVEEDHASVLSFEETVLHGNVMAAT